MPSEEVEKLKEGVDELTRSFSTLEVSTKQAANIFQYFAEMAHYVVDGVKGGRLS